VVNEADYCIKQVLVLAASVMLSAPCKKHRISRLLSRNFWSDWVESSNRIHE